MTYNQLCPSRLSLSVLLAAIPGRWERRGFASSGIPAIAYDVSNFRTTGVARLPFEVTP